MVATAAGPETSADGQAGVAASRGGARASGAWEAAADGAAGCAEAAADAAEVERITAIVESMSHKKVDVEELEKAIELLRAQPEELRELRAEEVNS